MASTDTLWQQILADIQLTESVAVYKTWFSQTTVINASEDELLIGCPNKMVYDQLNVRYMGKLEKAVERLHGSTVELRFIIQKQDRQEAATPLFDQLPGVESSPTVDPQGPVTETVVETGSAIPNSLNPNYTLDRFVVGGSNRMAHAAALAVSEQPGRIYNPLFLYGGTGVGKTHLVQAIGNALLNRKPPMKVLYFSVERFVNEAIEAMRFNKQNDFKKRYRSADVLIVDDIQFIAGKTATQEEFFHTFNELYASGRQIIICSDKPPREIDKMEDRLVSRFEGGLSIDINPPDFEVRSAIIRAKADQFNMNLSGDIADYIASIAPESIRALEGLMLKLQSLTLSSEAPLTLPMVQTLFTPQVTQTQMPKRLSANQILKLICETYGVTLKDVTGKSRTQSLVVPRQIAMYVLRQDAGLNLESIGQLLGGRDHTTVMHGIDKISKLADSDNQTRSALAALRQSMN